MIRLMTFVLVPSSAFATQSGSNFSSIPSTFRKYWAMCERWMQKEDYLLSVRSPVELNGVVTRVCILFHQGDVVLVSKTLQYVAGWRSSIFGSLCAFVLELAAIMRASTIWCSRHHVDRLLLCKTSPTHPSLLTRPIVRQSFVPVQKEQVVCANKSNCLRINDLKYILCARACLCLRVNVCARKRENESMRDWDSLHACTLYFLFCDVVQRYSKRP